MIAMMAQQVTGALVLSILSLTIIEIKGNQLGEYIKNFSPLVYNPIEVDERHSISKRSIYDKDISLQIKFGDRKFDLSLYPSEDSIYHANADLVLDGQQVKLDQTHMVSGHIKGDFGSTVTGSLIRGIFQGQITTGDGEEYYVDKKQYHPTHPLTAGDTVHSVIYRKDDVDVDKFDENRRVKRGANTGTCGLDRERHVWMDRVENSALEQDTENEGRKKRAIPNGQDNTCNLFLASDPELWDYFKSANNDDSVVIQEISSLFRDLVKEVEGIYRNAFNVEFRIDRLAINKTCVQSDDHWFCDRNLDVTNFLNLNTYTNHNAYCLAYILTYRDFADGTLGLAWVAKPGSSNGGICSKYKPYSENGSARKKSLNTGVVTTKNYGEKVPKLMTQLTLAHEFGHNFGSEHDPTSVSPSCTPYKDSNDEDGNYIMYYAAISGKRVNNNQFSSCSKTNISKVLDNSNKGCFVAKQGSWCGNQIVEGPDEVCDCGYDEDCKGNTCCNSQNITNNAKDACKLKTGASCDPSQGPCCSTGCQFQPAGAMTCSAATECAMEASCNGSGAACPNATPIDNVPCNDNTQVCNNTECSGSICTLIGSGGWTECSKSTDDGAEAASLCFISCAFGGTCYNSYDTASLPQDFKDLLTQHNNGNMIPSKPGQTCNKDQGFCDYFGSCRNILDLGPLARLKGLLLSFSSIENLTEWLKTNWWIPVISFVGLVNFMALLIKFGTVFTPSSNPDRAKARKINKPFTKPTRAPRGDHTQSEPMMESRQ